MVNFSRLFSGCFGGLISSPSSVQLAMNMSLVSLVSLFHEIRTRSATGWPSCSKILAFRPKNRFLHSNHRCLFPALLPRRFVSNQGNRRSLFATSLGLLVSFTIGASIAQVSASDGRRESVSVLDSVCKRKFTVIAAPGKNCP